MSKSFMVKKSKNKLLEPLLVLDTVSVAFFGNLLLATVMNGLLHSLH